MTEHDRTTQTDAPDTTMAVPTTEGRLSPEQATAVHGRYLGLLKTYGELDRKEHPFHDPTKLRVSTGRTCPDVRGRVKSTENDPLRMQMTIRLHSEAVSAVFDKANLPTDIADDVTIRLSIRIEPGNVFTVVDNTKRTSFMMQPTEVVQQTYVDGQRTDTDILGRGSDTYTTLQGIADFLEKEYRGEEPPKNRQIEASKPE